MYRVLWCYIYVSLPVPRNSRNVQLNKTVYCRIRLGENVLEIVIVYQESDFCRCTVNSKFFLARLNMRLHNFSLIFGC